MSTPYIRLYVCVYIYVCVEVQYQAARQTDRHAPKHRLFTRARITAQACHVAVVSLTVTDTTHHHTITPHRTALQPGLHLTHL